MSLSASLAFAKTSAPTRMTAPQFQTYAKARLGRAGIKATLRPFSAINQDQTETLSGVSVQVSKKNLGPAYHLLTGASPKVGDVGSIISAARGVDLLIGTRAGIKAGQQED